MQPTGAPPADLTTQAPVIGNVLPLGTRSIQPDPWPRASDLSADAADAGFVRVAGASIVGLAHASGGGCRQDAYAFCLARDGALCVVVADGLGSRSTSHLGAVLFCESVVLAAGAVGTAPDPLALATAASQRTERVAAVAYGLSSSDVACVGLVAVVGPAGSRLARVGDATAFVLRAGEFIELFPDDGRPVNVTGAVIPGDLKAAEMVSVPLDAPLALITDGLAIDLRTSPGVRAWLRTCWSQALGPNAMVDSLRYRLQGSHDDRTAVMLWPTSADPGRSEH